MVRPDPESWPSEAEWISCFDLFSNWGRWGDEDPLGTLNLITPKKVMAACALVREGRQISCSRTIEFGRKVPPEAAGNVPIHFMSQVAQNAPATGGYGSNDWIGMPLHGAYITHVDAHSHVVWNSRMYNNQPVAAVSAEFGARRGSVEPFALGVVTRGVLLDIPRTYDLDWLDAGYPIGTRDLEQAARNQGVEAESGDLVMVRTGYGAMRNLPEKKNDAALGADSSRSGLGVRSLSWFYEHDIAIIACDTPTEVSPSPYSWVAPFHAVAMRAMGAWIIDNGDFEELASACHERGRWDFMVTVTGLRLKNCTGSPVNPIAVL